MSYLLEQPAGGYEAGTELREVTLKEARAMECNRCGDCCNGLSDGVKKDEETGLPLFVWGDDFPKDLYKARYGQPLLQPIGFLDKKAKELPYQGEIGLVENFEVDVEGKSHTCFTCSMLQDYPQGLDGPETGCALYGQDKDPNDLSKIRPLNCGTFPVFDTAIDDTLVDGHTYIPHTGALPRCTWYGLCIVGPWRDTPYWRERWEKQQRGEAVQDLSIDHSIVTALYDKTQARRKTKDGSAPKKL